MDGSHAKILAASIHPTVIPPLPPAVDQQSNPDVRASQPMDTSSSKDVGTTMVSTSTADQTSTRIENTVAKSPEYPSLHAHLGLSPEKSYYEVTSPKGLSLKNKLDSMVKKIIK